MRGSRFLIGFRLVRCFFAGGEGGCNGSGASSSWGMTAVEKLKELVGW